MISHVWVGRCQNSAGRRTETKLMQGRYGPPWSHRRGRGQCIARGARSLLPSISGGGLYTAPSTIAANQTVTATATSVADNTKTASAAVNLIQPVAVSLSPGSLNLQQGWNQTFTPT